MEGGPGGGELQAQGLGVGPLDSDMAISTPDPKSPPIEMACRLRLFSVREAPSLCGTTTCGGRLSLPGAGSSDESGFEGPELMQDLANGLPRIYLPRTWVHKRIRKGRSGASSAQGSDGLNASHTIVATLAILLFGTHHHDGAVGVPYHVI